MRVLVVHNRYRSAQPSGENAVVDDEVGLLVEHGCRVERFETHSDEIETWPTWRKATLPFRVVWSASSSRELRAAIGRFQPDVVHFHNTFPLLSPAAIRAAKATGTPVVLTLHNFRPLCAAPDFMHDGQICGTCERGRAPFHALRHAIYGGSRTATLPVVVMNGLHRRLGTWTKQVDTTLFPSEFARSKYLAAGWPASRCFVKHNTAPDPGFVRQGPGEGFVAVSRLSSEKGIDSLIDAWRESGLGGSSRLSIIGSGDEAEALKRRASGLPGVEWLGQLPHVDVMTVMAKARAVVVPSRCYEVFPRVVVEAFSVGVPVVATRIGALAEVVDHGATGLHAGPDSPSSLAAALIHLTTNPREASQLGGSARRAYEERFAPQPTMRVLLRLYGSVCGPSSKELRAASQGVLA